MAGTATRARRQPPRRGVPFYDVDKGRMRIAPPGGGKVVDYLGPAESSGFSPGRALRRSGVRAGRAADRAATRAPAATGRALRRADALPELGGGRLGLGGLLIYGFATIVGLALLENALSGRGPAAVETVLGAFGGGLKRLVDPGDPVVSRGEAIASGGATVGAAAGALASPTAAARGASIVGGKVTIGPNANRAGAPLHVQVLDFVRQVSGIVGHALTIGTGTNHSRLTVNGNESAHWNGWAADIPATGAENVRIGRAALIAAGMAPAQANSKNGGLFNVGAYQIIFNANSPSVGGDHTNHVHIGIQSWAQRGG